MLAYVNGEYVEDENATISVRDRGFMVGDAVFEVWRTYGGKVCQPMVDQNLERLGRSLRYMELDPEPILSEVRNAAPVLLERNHERILELGDALFFVIVTRGTLDELAGGELNPSVVMFVNVLPARAVYGDDLYGNGARLATSLQYRDPWGPVDPRVKTTSRFAYVRAERKMARAGSRTWVLFCDNEGNPTEVSGANLFIVEKGSLLRPPRQRVLGGINMTTFLTLAQGLGAPLEERTLTMYDYLNADEVILTTTSVCAVRVTELDGIKLTPRSDVYDRTIAAWKAYVGHDFVAAARRRAGIEETATA